MRFPFVATLLLVCASALPSAQTTVEGPGGQPLRVVNSIDLRKYAGKWFEVARLPNKFQNRCASDVVAHYTTRPDGGLNVVNQCRKADGQMNQSRGIARKAGDRQNSATLKVRFGPAIFSFMPNVWGDYWIIGLGPDYTWAVVGVPSRRHLWILSRTAAMSDNAYEQALEIAKGNGFDTAALVKTKHSPSR
jgi:apolipoprotein D and lipocalin family protein